MRTRQRKKPRRMKITIRRLDGSVVRTFWSWRTMQFDSSFDTLTIENEGEWWARGWYTKAALALQTVALLAGRA